MTETAYNLLLTSMVAMACVVFVALYFVKAGYGKFRTPGWGFSINNKLAWVLMEAPVFLTMAVLWLESSDKWQLPQLVLFLLFELHYFQRSFVFPLLLKGKGMMPVSIMLMGVTFNVVNGMMQAGGLFVSGRYTTSNAIHQGAKLAGEARRTYMDWLFDYEYRLLGLPAPDAVIFLDVEVPLALANIEKRQAARDIHETKAGYLSLCRESALEAAQRYGWYTVACGADGAMRPEKDIAKDIMRIINQVGVC